MDTKTGAGLETIGEPWLWAVFGAMVLVMLIVDLVLVGRGQQKEISFRESAIWSCVWVGISLLFAAGLWWYLEGQAGPEVATDRTLEFLAGYLIEKSLAVDNVFVWLMIFSFFGVPLALQKRVLAYGVVGAILMRAVLIFVGAWALARFHWILYVFGAILLFTGVKMWVMAEQKPDLANNPLLKWLGRHIPSTPVLHGERFFVREQGVRLATPLFFALVFVEFSDLVFAVDSIPAIFAVTSDPFIVLTSNVFAILGLRAMYFLLAGMAERFSLLKYGLAAVLVFIGAKMMLIDLYKIPIAVSLAVVATLIGTSIVLSLKSTAGRERGAPPP